MSLITNHSLNAGRSMIEMLGVLAIIGMLSIGALVGVKFAFDAIKANNLLNDVSLYAATITHNDYDLDTQEFNPSTEFAFWAEWIEERNLVFAVDVEEVPEGVCNTAKNKAKDVYLIQVNGTENGECNDENNQMKFIMNGQDICSENCSNICCDGVCCPSNEHTCVAGKCHKEASCPSGQYVCGENCYDPNFESCCSGTICESGNVCVGVNKNECCAFGHATSNYKLCCDFEQTPCDDECCPSGTFCSNGVCRTTECYTKGSTSEKCTGSNCDCYIGENRCGTGCSADGLSCSYGYCQNLCPTGTIYSYDSVKNAYGCLSNDETGNRQYICLNESIDNCYWISDHNRCGHSCTMNGKSCTWGACYYNYCPAGWVQSGQLCSNEIPRNQNSKACMVEDNPNSKHGRYCLIGLEYPENNCASSCDMTEDGWTNCAIDICETCPEGWTWEKDSKGRFWCKTASLECKLETEGIQCRKIGETNYCATACSLKSDGSITCTYGSCDVCPEGTVPWQRNSNYAGCSPENDTTLGCTKYSNNYKCFRNGKECGNTCTDYFGSGCSGCFPECPDGWSSSSYLSSVSCSKGNIQCIISTKTCYIGGLRCGTGCDLDGTNCTTGICHENECDAGQILSYDADNNVHTCKALDNLTCSEDGSGTYSCQFGTKPCGTGCAEDGSNCSTGVCVAEECTEDTSLSLVTNAYFGCYSATNGTKCYRYGNAYVCYKNSVECGTGCNIDGTDCNVGQTCIVEE